MCDGPAGTLLVAETDGRLFKLDINKFGAQSVFVQNIPTGNGKPLLELHYVECHDICMYMVCDMKEDPDYEIIAAMLGSNIIVWRLFGPLHSRIMKPESITSDSQGNAYVNDRGNNRILQINSLTGEVLRILLFEEEGMIWSIRWSNEEPNLTLSTKTGISTYFLPK